jgi:uncharacterized membrane protein YphA (DoxX/SURF4 family)
MKVVLWILQSLLAVAFLASGVMKLFFFDKMVMQTPGIVSLHGLFIFIGLCEIAGALGLILPGLTGIRPILTAWAAAGLATIMIFAAIFHVSRGEYDHLPPVLILFVWGRGFRPAAGA